MKPTRRQQIEGARVQIEVEKRLRERERRVNTASGFDDNEGVVQVLDQMAKLAASAAEAKHVNPFDPVFGPGREANRIALEHARQNRGEWRSDGPLAEQAPPPVMFQVRASHPEAGVLSLHTDGTSWWLRNRGQEYGVGKVLRSERTQDGGYAPRAAVVETAASRALADPDGPVEPPGTPVFYGTPEGDVTTQAPPPVLPAPAAVKRTRRGLRRG